MNIQPDDNQSNNMATALAGAPNSPTQSKKQAATAAASTNVKKSEDGHVQLDDVKMAAITGLRPLVDKLVLPTEEKFDTYLLLIRTTDDETLIAPAHEIARQIEDPSRRAMALLDIIKEIDYLANKSSAQTNR